MTAKNLYRYLNRQGHINLICHQQILPNNRNLLYVVTLGCALMVQLGAHVLGRDISICNATLLVNIASSVYIQTHCLIIATTKNTMHRLDGQTNILLLDSKLHLTIHLQYCRNGV
jgi:hypothetical protein